MIPPKSTPQCGGMGWEGFWNAYLTTTTNPSIRSIRALFIVSGNRVLWFHLSWNPSSVWSLDSRKSRTQKWNLRQYPTKSRIKINNTAYNGPKMCYWKFSVLIASLQNKNKSSQLFFRIKDLHFANQWQIFHQNWCVKRKKREGFKVDVERGEGFKMFTSFVRADYSHWTRSYSPFSRQYRVGFFGTANIYKRCFFLLRLIRC